MHSRKPASARLSGTLKGLKLRTSGALGEDRQQPRRVDGGHPAGRRVFNPAPRERSVVDAIEWAQPRHQHRAPVASTRSPSTSSCQASISRGCGARSNIFDQAPVGRLRRHPPKGSRSQRRASLMATIESWMNINLMDADALNEARGQGRRVHKRRPPGYIDGVAKATREIEDKYIAADGGWFKKVGSRANVPSWRRVRKPSAEYRSEFR